LSRRKYWLAFNHVAGVGPLRLARLREHFGSLEAAWHASEGALRDTGLDRRTLHNLLEARRTLDLGAIQQRLDDLGAAALTLEDPDYPALLRELPDAPPVLYVRGTLSASDAWTIAIVGTRKASAYGRDTAYHLAADFAREGITVVSGLALGIDAAAHKGALENGGRTLAVLPCGIDTIYPPEHRALAQAIMRQGAVVTDFPPGTQAEGKNFPPRNRIISGLALGVIVVEAPLKSGALLTVDSANEQGREIFAVPGQTTAPASKGANRLIQDGAKLIMSVDDVLEELNLTRSGGETRTAVREIVPENDTERALLACLGEEPRHIDEVCRSSGLPIATVSSTLALMELKGQVRQVGSMLYTLNRGGAAIQRLD
jgi:DNA processing protein